MSLNAGFDDDPAGYDELRSGWMQRRRVERFAEHLAGARPGERVLELGCGTGAILEALAERRPDLHLVGVEPISDYVEFAARRTAGSGGRVTVHQGTAEAVDGLGLAPVDWVISSDVLHHVTDEELVAAAVARACSPGARWLAIEPSVLNPYVALYQARTAGERNFRPRRFLSVAERTGWSQVGRTGHMFLLPAAVKDPAAPLVRAESVLERVPGLGGAVVIELALRRAGQHRR